MRSLAVCVFALLIAILATNCDEDECSTSADCSPGEVCNGGVCESMAGDTDVDSDTDSDTDDTDTGESAPVITDVQLSNDWSGGDLTILQNIYYYDLDGDASSFYQEIVDIDVDNNTTGSGSINDPAKDQMNGAMAFIWWTCQLDYYGEYSVTMQVIVSDQHNNESEPYEYTMYCQY